MRPATLLRLSTIVIVLASPRFSTAAEPEPVRRDVVAGESPRTGSFQIQITERSKASAILGITARMGWGGKADVEAAAKKDGGEVDYDISKETFDVFVPEDYKADEPYGLIVWINPGKGGAPRREWLDVLRKHKLAWIGATNTGNDRTKWVRLGVAIDAAAHMQKAYKIDPNRVYASGVSGGGRCASLLAIGFPDVFTGGGFPIVGTNYFRIVEVGPGKDGGKEWYQRYFDRPAAKLLAMATKERRFVLLTGDTDDNQQQTKLYAEAMKKDGFKYVTYLQVPGMGHHPPDAEWFEKGIVTLDEPRDAIAKAAQTGAKEATPASPPLKQSPPAAVATEPIPDEEAEKLMRLARLYISNRLYNKAREKLNEIVKDHPASPPAAEAKKLLNEIGTK